MSSRILVDEIYGKTSNSSALTIGSNGLVTPKAVAFQVEATDTDQSYAASAYAKITWETVTLDTEVIGTPQIIDIRHRLLVGIYLVAQSEFNFPVL